MMWGYGYGLGSWFALVLIGFFAILVLVGIALFVVWLVLRSTESSHERRAEWCEIADRRFAAGEISREEYEEICRTIRRV